MALTNTARLSSVMQIYYDKRLLLRAEKELVYKQLGRVGTLPNGEGKTIYWTRYTNMPAQTAALAEGTDPTARGISAVTVSAVLAQYGDLTQVTDVLSLTAFDNVISSAVELLGYQAGLTVDSVVRDVVGATTNVIYASGVAARTALIAQMSCKLQTFVKQLRLFELPTLSLTAKQVENLSLLFIPMSNTTCKVMTHG